MFNPRYESQLQLLLPCLPAVFGHSCFALKGGSAINLFVRNMPRLSVDIDLTYVHLKQRDDTLNEIEDCLLHIAKQIELHIPDTAVKHIRIEGRVAKLLVLNKTTDIKIEPNLILRGHVQSPRTIPLCSSAEERYGHATSVKVVSDADLYGGKLCAALDRQHPRDLFDMKLLLDDTGITPDIRKAFVVYLASHNRPMNELLNPRIQDISETFYNEFQGMTQTDVTLEELQSIQNTLATDLVSSLNADERNFLLSVKQGEPKWDLMDVENIERFPAIQWKLLNIQKMSQSKRQEMFNRLECVFEQ